MYLGPHHFQAQSRYFEDSIHFSADSLWFSPFGFLGYELDAGALSNGTLKLTHARGVFADGLPFDMPSADPLPEARSIEKAFPPTSNALIVYLAVPEHKQRGGNCSLESGPAATKGTRFIAEEHKVVDEITGGEEKPVRFGRKAICFLVEGEVQRRLANAALSQGEAARREPIQLRSPIRTASPEVQRLPGSDVHDRAFDWHPV